MSPGAPPRRREPLVDALRGAAIAGVVVVNAVGYTFFPETAHIVPPARPAGDPAAIAAQATVIALLQAKAYPLLSFLFGLSFALSMRARGADAPAHRRRRMARLLLLGVLHGALVYAGDVLTAYALTGLVLLLAGHRRLRWWRWLAVVTWLVTALMMVGQWVTYAALGDLVRSSEGPLRAAYGGAPDLAAHVAITAPAYLWAQVITAGLVGPQLVGLMALGVLAARLRLLTHRRWRAGWSRAARVLLPSALAANVAIAVAAVRGAAVESDPPAAALAALLLAGPLLSAGYVAAAVTWRPRLLLAFAGVGRFTLSVYLASSVMFLAVLGGAGLGLGPELGSVGTLAVALGTWAVLVGLAHGAARAGWRGPLERWLSS